MPRHTDNTWLERIAGYLTGGGSPNQAMKVQGNVQDGASDSGNPVKIGGVAKTTLPTAKNTGERVNALFSKTGKQVTVGALREQLGKQATTITASTAETTIVTADSTFLLDVYGLMLTNTSATTTKVTIRDATGAGTPFVIEVPTLDTRGFMLSVDSAIPQTAANNNWTATCGTSVSSLEVVALYAKNL